MKRGFIQGLIIGSSLMVIISALIILWILLFAPLITADTEVLFNKNNVFLISKYNNMGDKRIYYRDEIGNEYMLMKLNHKYNERIINIDFSDGNEMIGILINSNRVKSNKNRFVVFSKKYIEHGKRTFMKMVDKTDYITDFCFSGENIYYRMKNGTVGMFGRIDSLEKQEKCRFNKRDTIIYD